MGSRTVVGRPLAIVSAVTTTPVTSWVSVEQYSFDDSKPTFIYPNIEHSCSPRVTASDDGTADGPN